MSSCYEIKRFRAGSIRFKRALAAVAAGERVPAGAWPDDFRLRGFDRENAEAGFPERLREARGAVGLTIEPCGYIVDPVDPAGGAANWRRWERRNDRLPDAGEALIIEAVVGVAFATLFYGADTVTSARRRVLDKLQAYRQTTARRPA